MTIIRSIQVLNRELGISNLPFAKRQELISGYMKKHPDTTYIAKTGTNTTSHEHLLNMAKQNNWKTVYVEDLS